MRYGEVGQIRCKDQLRGTSRSFLKKKKLGLSPLPEFVFVPLLIGPGDRHRKFSTSIRSLLS